MQAQGDTVYVNQARASCFLDCEPVVGLLIIEARESLSECQLWFQFILLK
jgi:hypothetical protein